MLIQTLTDAFSAFTRQKRISINTVHPERGIKFIVPAITTILSSEYGDLFVGNSLEFSAMVTKKEFVDGATYMISTRPEADIPFMPRQNRINVLFLSITVNEILTTLSQLIHPWNDEETDQENRIMSTFWTDILDGTVTESSDALSRIRAFPHPVKEYFACIVLRTSKADEVNLPLTDRREHIRNFFPDMNFFFYNSECIILYTQDQMSSDDPNLDFSAFYSFIRENHFFAGVSYISKWPGTYHTLYKNAMASMNLGIMLSNPLFPEFPGVFRYSEYQTFYTIHLAAKQFVESHHRENICYLAHPDAILIYRYDRENSDHLLDILMVYLIYNCNIDKTAKRIFMHRNTLYNKINKIQNLLGKKIDAYENLFALQFSCMIILYQIHYESRVIYE